jgi:hypothetical protein
MNTLILTVGLLLLFAWAVSYAYDHLVTRRTARREREELFAQLAALPPVNADFATPEGAILCLEAACQRRDIEAAVACRDFEAESRLWLQERGQLSKHIKDDHLPEIIRTTEKAFRDSLAKNWPVEPGPAKSYFPKREPYRDGIVLVNEVTRKSDGSLFKQQILVTETNKGWRVVTYLPNNPNEAI